jgi:hypothetical protein
MLCSIQGPFIYIYFAIKGQCFVKERISYSFIAIAVYRVALRTQNMRRIKGLTGLLYIKEKTLYFTD